MTTGRAAYCRFSSWRAVRPSMPGRGISRRTKSGGPAATNFRADSPSGAVSTSKPSSARMPATVWRIWGSSSTTRMVPGIGLPAYRQVNDEFSSLRLVVFHVNMPLVFHENGLDNGQPQPGAPPLGGKIRLKNAGLVRLGGAAAGVGHHQAHPLRRSLFFGGQGNAAGLWNGGQGIIHQVQEHPFDFLHLIADDLGTLIKNLAVIGEMPQVTAPEALRGQFNGGERVFYFMGDP